VIAKKLAEDRHLRAGESIALRTVRGDVAMLRIIGVVDDKSHLTGDLVVSNAELGQAFAADKDAMVLVGTAAGVDHTAVQHTVQDLLKRQYPQVKALSNQQFIDEFAGRVDRLLALIDALLALTVIVALFGIVNTLVLSITERTRELGMLRAIGTSRRQIRSMIRYEAMIMGLIGGILGIVLGTGLAYLVSRVIDDFTLTIPIGSVLALLVLAAVAGVLASVLPARRAARLDVLQALAYE
jgi:putative ABC transport system permease protein